MNLNDEFPYTKGLSILLLQIGTTPTLASKLNLPQQVVITDQPIAAFNAIIISATDVTIQQKINAAMKYKDVTQQQLADEFGISQQAMGKRLKTGKFTTSELEKIAARLGCKYISYFEFDENTRI